MREQRFQCRRARERVRRAVETAAEKEERLRKHRKREETFGDRRTESGKAAEKMF